MLAPRFGAGGDPSSRGSRDYDDEEASYDMDEMDEQNLSSEFDSPPRGGSPPRQLRKRREDEDEQ